MSVNMSVNRVAILIQGDTPGHSHSPLHCWKPACLVGLEADFELEANSPSVSIAAFIGYKNIIFLEARDLEGMEISGHARESAATNPLVGGEWLPLLDLMARHFRLHKPGRTWVMDVFPHEAPFERGSPYVQAMMLPEGVTHLEIGPTTLLEEKDETHAEFLHFLGWSPPLDDRSPNYSVSFTPGISVEYIAATALQALIVLFGVSTKDGFSLSGVGGAVKEAVPGIESLDPQEEYKLVAPVFGLTSMHLVRNLANRSGTHVTVVGDDWQSINRFAGADISAMTEFEQHFGENRRFELTRTFRCVQQVCDVSSKFIMKNPRQISKIVEGKSNFKSSHISIVWVDEGRWQKPTTQSPDEGLLLAIHRATADLLPGMGRESLKVLGRYGWETHKDKRPDVSALNELVDVSWGTIHSSKGLEADHIVIVGVDSDDRYGFPSAIEDDPVLNLVMPGIDDYAHSEERRLLYVALTRARKSVTLIGKRQKPSPFLIELQRAFDIPVMNSKGELKTEKWCPRCGNTLDVRINGKTGAEFHGCRSFPSCRYTEAIEVS